MTYVEQSFVCPVCEAEFVLKNRRLVQWLKRKEVKPDTRGPYCNYVCSNRANIRKTRTHQSRASSTLVNAADS